MKKLHKADENVAKDIQISESDKKHDVNLKNNSSLYFQIGLILCLLATYGLFQMEFEKSIPYFAYGEQIEEPPITFKREVPVIQDEPVKERQPDRQVAVLTSIAPIIKDNDAIIDVPDIVLPSIPETDVPSVPNTGQADTTPDLPKEWNMNDVEKVPIFPGCESAKNNAERMACMSDKLTTLIQRKFNTDLAHELGLTGIQKIQVQFKINDKGYVTDIKTRSPYSQLEKEAERVVSKIPVMTPGMQRNTPVSVVYYLPIAFQVH